jgi:hypothetical protein
MFLYYVIQNLTKISYVTEGGDQNIYRRGWGRRASNSDNVK